MAEWFFDHLFYVMLAAIFAKDILFQLLLQNFKRKRKYTDFEKWMDIGMYWVLGGIFYYQQWIWGLQEIIVSCAVCSAGYYYMAFLRKGNSTAEQKQ